MEMILILLFAALVLSVAGVRALLHRRYVASILYIVFAAVPVSILIIFYISLRPKTDLESAVVRANQLIAAAGGSDRICDEAGQIFERFGVSKEKDLTDAELSDYPAIAALKGHFVIIEPDSYIRIRFGTHTDGFEFAIPDRNCRAQLLNRGSSYKLGNSCIVLVR